MKKKTNNRSIGSNSEKIYGERRKRFPFLHSNSERDMANLNFPRPKCVLYQLEMRAIHSFVRLFGLHASCHLIRGMAIRMGWMNTKNKRQHIKWSVCTMYMYTVHSIVFVMHVDLSFFRRSDVFFLLLLSVGIFKQYHPNVDAFSSCFMQDNEKSLNDKIEKRKIRLLAAP